MAKVVEVLLTSLVLYATVLAQAPAAGTPVPEPAATAEYNAMVDQYFDAYFHFHPSEGTAAGFHQYDDQLEDLSQSARDAELSFLLEAKQAAGYFHTDRLSEEQRTDLKLLSDAINARILELQEIRMWQKNPDIYSSSGSASIFGLMSRKFAPPAERLKSVIAREQKIPANLAAAKVNLKNPPRVYTEIAIEQMPGIISFFQKDVPEAFKDVTDPQLLAEFKASNGKVIAELRALSGFPEDRSSPRFEGRLPPRPGAVSQEAALRRHGGDAARPPAADRLRRPAQKPGGAETGGRAHRSGQDAGADSGGTGAGPSQAR